MPALTAVTWNVHGCVGTDRIRDPQRVAAVLRAAEADVVGLQEIDCREEDQLELIAAATSLRPIAGPTRRDGAGYFGNALLTRHVVQSVVHDDLSVPGREPRGILDVSLRIGSCSVHVVLTHFGLRAGERAKQTRALLDVVERSDPAPLVLLGDFNEWRRRAAVIRRIRARLGAAPAVASFPSRLPCLALDRVWTRPAAALRRVEALRLAGYRRASDHLPVRAQVRFDDAPAGALSPPRPTPRRARPR